MSTHANRGSELEKAITRAAKIYRREGRADVTKIATPSGLRRDGSFARMAKAGVDFTGCEAGGRGLFIEAKSTRRASWPISEINDAQIKFMDRRHAMGARCILIVDFVAVPETYAISWEHFAMFLINPWRQSLSLDWCRAHGMVVPDQLETISGRLYRTCRFLDGFAHPEMARAEALVLEEKTRASTQPRGAGSSTENAVGRLVFRRDPGAPQLPARSRTKEEALESVRESVLQGTDRQRKKSGQGNGIH